MAQLRFAPQAAILRQIERAERLADDIEPHRMYPEDWIVQQITGYRPQLDQPALLVGEAILADLSAVVERLSTAARLHQADLASGAFLSVEQLCQRWQVSRRTVERYRRRGLVARRVRGDDARPRLFFAVEVIERFERRHADRLAAARAYRRLPVPMRTRIVRLAERGRQRRGWTLNQAALRLARHFRVGHETVRELLQAHDARAATPIFAEPGPPTPAQRDLAERAARRGHSPTRIAAHLKRTPASIRRAIADRRAELLRALLTQPPLLWHAPPERNSSADQPERASEALSHEACRTGLGTPGATDAFEFLVVARATPPPTHTHEQSLVSGYRALLTQAAGAIAALPRDGVPALAVDEIETLLLWAARLKAELIRGQLSLIVRTLEQALERRLEDVPGGLLPELLQVALDAASQTTDRYDPGRGGRLAGRVNVAVTRVGRFWAARLGPAPRGAGRAGPLLAPGRIPLLDWTRHVAPWQHRPVQRGGKWTMHPWVEAPDGVRAGSAWLTDELRPLVVQRFGWSAPPQSVATLARALAVSPGAVTRRLQAALRQAIRATRQLDHRSPPVAWPQACPYLSERGPGGASA